MKNLLKSVSDFAGKIFHDRRIVIVSEGKASTIAISRNLQIIAAVILVLGVCLLPFSAGRIAAVSSISAKRFIAGDVSTMEQRVEVLQNDVLLLEEYMRALHKYDNFDLYNKDKDKNDQRSDSGEAGPDAVAALEEKRDDIMVGLKKRTLIRIVTIENFLHSAGLDYAKITGKQHASLGGSGENAGGPYIPVNINDIANMEQDKNITPEFIDELNYLFELQKIVNNLPFSNPVSYKKVSSYYGIRHDPFNGTLSMHSGIDLQGDKGAQVASTGPGTVDFSGFKGAYGNMVEIDHGFGFKTRYGHLSKILVKQGDKITRGQIIAVQGCTGRCTGDHVHYEVRVNDVPVNPMTYLIKAREIQYYYDKKL